MSEWRINLENVKVLQFSSVTQSCPTLCDPINSSTPGFPVHHWLPELTQNSCSLSRWCHPAISSSVIPFSSCLQYFQHQSLFQWVSSSHQVPQILELQLQHQSFQWIFRTDFLWDWLVGSPWSPRDWESPQQSSPTPQMKSINSSVLSLIYGPTLTSIHDYRKNHSFD